MSSKKFQPQNAVVAAQQAYMAIAAEETSDIVILIYKNGKITWVNNSFVKLYGYESEQVTGINFADFLENNQASKVKADEIRSAITSGTDYTGTVFLINAKKRTPFWNEFKIKAVKDEQGEHTCFVAVARDITSHIKKNEELLYSELRWKFALEESGDGFFEYDLVNHKFFGSDNLLSLIAVEADATELDFAALINIIHPDDSEAAVNGLFDLISGKTDMLRHELRIKNTEGNYIWIMVRATVSNKNAAGKALTLIGTTSDITYIKETEAALVKAKNEAESASEYKNQFLSTMSHEIRTPLNAIIGITDFMLLKKPEGELKENLDILSFSANHLLSLINDVLDLSKIESGKMEFVQAEFNLADTISSIYQTFKTKSNEKGIDLSYTVDKSLPESIIGDSMRLTQIMNNLVNNAIKFTATGSVKINVSLQKAMGKKAGILFEVIDTGIGIDKKKQQHIFEDFVQANSSISHQYGGTGLGLAITKKLITLQGGDIHVESAPEKGSRFYFELEFEFNPVSKANYQKDKIEKPETANLNNIKVLLVEDILVNQKVAVSYLNHWQAEVVCADNGQQALDIFSQQNFDILLIDLYMPVMNGFDAITAIRKLLKGKNIPIIALTASVETSVIDKAIACGADVCMGKPFEAKRLKETILKMTGRVSAATSAKHADKKEKKNKFVHIKLKRIEDASLGSKPFIKDMIALLKTEIPSGIEMCHVELNKKNYTGFSEQVHKLKNSLLMIGLDDLKGELVMLEENSRNGKDIDKLPAVFTKITDKWALASKELNQL